LSNPDLKYVRVRLPSGSQRLISINAKGTLGIVANEEHALINLKKAGRSRWLNRRPSVRGVAMNPVDHPHGGGQGKTKGGRPSVTPFSWPTKGQPTRNPRKKNMLILTTKKKSN
jgi:large subunit ribosomal protein L2